MAVGSPVTVRCWTVRHERSVDRELAAGGEHRRRLVVAGRVCGAGGSAVSAAVYVGAAAAELRLANHEIIDHGADPQDLYAVMGSVSELVRTLGDLLGRVHRQSTEGWFDDRSRDCITGVEGHYDVVTTLAMVKIALEPSLASLFGSVHLGVDRAWQEISHLGKHVIDDDVEVGP